MSIRKTSFEVDGYYHLYNRGNNREAIFFENDNYLFFLKQFRKFLLPHLDVVAYCLMPTHYHFLVRVKPVSEQIQKSEVLETSDFSRDDPDSSQHDSARIYRAMQRFSISYTKAINKRFDRVGSLFQGSYQAIQVQSESHIRHLCRYIHSNPVKDGLVANPSDWPYCNYLEWIGERDGTLFDPKFIHHHFNTPEEYREFLLEGLYSRDLPEEIKQFISQ